MANCVQNIFNDFPYKGNRPLFLAICVVQNRHAGNMRRAGRRQTKACIILKWCFSLFVLSQCVTCSPVCTLCCQKRQTVGNSIISASAATAELNRTCTLKIKELIILHQFGIMPELSAVRRSSFPLCSGGVGKGQNEKRVPD